MFHQYLERVVTLLIKIFNPTNNYNFIVLFNIVFQKMLMYFM